MWCLEKTLEGSWKLEEGSAWVYSIQTLLKQEIDLGGHPGPSFLPQRLK